MQSTYAGFVLMYQVSAVTVCVTWSAVPMAESALQIVLMATSVCAHLASEEHFVKRVSQPFSLFPPLTPAKARTQASSLQGEF